MLSARDNRPLLKLDDSSSYLVGLAVPNLRESHPDEKSLREEYDRHDANDSDFTGLDAWLNHAGAKTRVGSVVGYRVSDHAETLIELPPSNSAPSIFGKNGLMSGYYSDLSLQHHWRKDPTTGAVTKTALEVSLCQEGAREGSHITEFFPSLRLLRCQSYASLAQFTGRYGYEAPPLPEGVAERDWPYVDVDNTPALASYVENRLWPAVRARRTELLKLDGYIAASKQHNPTTPAPEMTTPATPVVTATAPLVVAAAQNAAPVESASSAIANAFAGAARPATKADGTPATSTTSPGAPLAIPEPAAPSEEESNRIAQLEAIKKNMDEKDALIAQMQEQLVAASKAAERERQERAEAEIRRAEVEAKTAMDMLIDNTDAWDDSMRTQMKDHYGKQIEHSRFMPPEKKGEFIKTAIEGLRACSADAQAKEEAKQEQRAALSANQWASNRERELGSELARRKITEKHAKVIGGSYFTPPTPASIEATEEPASKRSAVGESGAVVASRTATTTSAPAQGSSVPELTPQSEDWAGRAQRESVAAQLAVAAQSGSREILILSAEDLRRGGFVVEETNRVVRSKKPGVDKEKELALKPRFEDEHAFTLKEWNGQCHKDLIASIKTGVLHYQGKATKPYQMDDSVLETRAAIAKKMESDSRASRQLPQTE